MRYMRIALLFVLLAAAVGHSVAMLPPDTFKEPIFAAQDGDDGAGEHTEFA